MATHPHDRQHFNAAVFIAIRNEKGEYLLQLRQNTSFMNGYWDFAAGGHLEKGESLQECAVREAQEEAGLTLRTEDLKLIRILQYDVADSIYPYIDFMFLCDKFSGEAATNEPNDVGELKWFKPGEFPGKCTVAVRLHEQMNFSEELSFSYISHEEHERIIGEKFKVEI